MLALKIKEDKKSFYADARSKTKSRAQIGPLRNAEGKEINDAEAMDESFNEQFLSVFTTEDMTNIPVPANVYTGNEKDKLVNVEISVEDVKNRLAGLKEDKSPGPDDFSPRLLKWISATAANKKSLLIEQKTQS